MVSSGKGRTTCGYFSYPDGNRIIYASTEAASVDCPAPPDRSRGYVWAVYPTFDVVIANADGSDPRRLITSAGYDAEATWCHKGGKIIFTSDRDGDLDLYEMDENGGNIRRLTTLPGYDGGAFYNSDCTEIVWRASRPEGAELQTYRQLLAENLVRPSKMELLMEVMGLHLPGSSRIARAWLAGTACSQLQNRQSCCADRAHTAGSDPAAHP